MAKARIWRAEVTEMTVYAYDNYKVVTIPTGLYLWHYRDGEYWVDASTFDLLCRGVREVLGT